MARLAKLCGSTLLTVGVVAIVGCGGSVDDLTGTSTCQEFMEASPEKQSETISRLATEYNAPDLATPLGAPNVSYQCASSPDEQIGNIFEQFSKGVPAEPSSSPEEASETSTSTDLDSRPQIEASTDSAPSGLVTEDVVEGSGVDVRAGDQVFVRYVGALFDTGEEFDSRWVKGQEYTFEIGAGELIEGLDNGLEGMRVGGRRKLVVPPSLAYGSAGVPPDIPPNATLVYIVDLIRYQ